MKSQNYTKETIRSMVLDTHKELDPFSIGDSIEVHQIIKEGDKERIQVFAGDVIAIKNDGVSKTFTVRKIAAHGVAVERIFPYHSPLVKSVKVVKHGNIRRAKLYYVRDRVGKAARLKEKRKVSSRTVSATDGEMAE